MGGSVCGHVDVCVWGCVCGHVDVGGWFIVSVYLCVPTNFMSACPSWYAYVIEKHMHLMIEKSLCLVDNFLTDGWK